MKRYTVRLRPPPGLQEIATLRAAIEKHLLNFPITFRLGAAEAREGGEAILEMASDSGMEDLRSKLGKIAGAIGSELLALEWGWHITPAAEGAGDPDDPLRAGHARSDRQEIFSYDSRRRAVIALGSLLVLPAILVVAILRVYVPGYDLPFLAAWSVLWFLFAIVPVRNPWSLIRSVACSPESLELRYWMRGPRVFHWEEIAGLDVQLEQLILRARGGKVRVAIPWISDRDGLLATIRSRAHLWFVEGIPPASAWYRRADSD